MSRLPVHLVAAARPNFMKVAPLYHALAATDWAAPVIVHTGQHYDYNMSDAFFADLGLPEPGFHLGVGSGSHGEQTGHVMIEYEKVCVAHRPACVIVVGDVNSTIACAMSAAKLHVPVVHLEAGLRSNDRGMPEELNRLATDAISDLLWTPSPDADENLRSEGKPETAFECVGNIMLDSFELLRRRIEAAGADIDLDLPERFGVMTLHRPSNVDDEATLERIIDGVTHIAANQIPVLFVAHPRTRERLTRFTLLERLTDAPGLTVLEPLSYVPFMHLVTKSALCITDSGGLQEETTYLGIPCLTLRPNTERPITITMGTNRLVTPDTLQDSVTEALSGTWPTGRRPELWDGKTASRCVASLKRFLDRG
ncbi:MAG: UDP-N-acetylglucosamine 2-epimerase (non-hydrolyzing) [Pseudomonadota bacterium]